MAPTCVEIKSLRRVRAESSYAPDALVDFHTGADASFPKSCGARRSTVSGWRASPVVTTPGHRASSGEYFVSHVEPARGWPTTRKRFAPVGSGATLAAFAVVSRSSNRMTCILFPAQSVRMTSAAQPRG